MARITMLPIIFNIVLLVAMGTEARDAKATCPTASAISPCVCQVSGTDVNVDCSAVDSSGQLHDIFYNKPFSVNVLNKFTISGNPNVRYFYEGFTQGVAFKQIEITGNSALTEIRGTSFQGSETHLVSANLSGNALETYSLLDADDSGANPFGLLTSLDLSNNAISESIQDIACPPLLTTLWLKNNRIASLAGSAFSACTALDDLDVGGNFFSLLQADVFADIGTVTRLSVSGCPALSSILPGAFPGSDNLAELILSDNVQLTTISVGAIEDANLLADIRIDLTNGGLTNLDQDVFEPILAKMAAGGGILDVTGNNIGCTCDMAWLITDSAMRIHVRGKCPDDIEISLQDPEPYLDNC